MSRSTPLQLVVLALTILPASTLADEPTKPKWKYSPALLRPFWECDTVEGESVLFIKDSRTEKTLASVLFPINQVLAVRNSAGDITYEEGRDYRWQPKRREIVLPPGSRIVSHTPADLRRPDDSQRHKLTHRDGNGEIFFGGRLEYAEMQTCITYRPETQPWRGTLPRFDPKALPRSVARLQNKQPLSIVVLGDSISAGANASGNYDSAPFQPAYPELLERHLHEAFGSDVTLNNLSVGGTVSKWGLTQVDKVVASKPHLVVLAFGMNDSAGRSVQEYKTNTQNMIVNIRKQRPNVEFVLVASMLGNRGWIRLRHERFPEYRDALAQLAEPGVALADLTSIWTEFLQRKKDWDQTGNGVNHPNDFGHRVYAQVISRLLTPDE